MDVLGDAFRPRFFWSHDFTLSTALGLRNRYDSALSGFALGGWTRALGIALMAAGGILAFACVSTFVTRGEGTPAPFDPPRKFVAAGPYRFVRDPMRIGGFIVLLGFGL